MKIAINCAFYQPKGGGISEYIYNLVTNLLNIESGYEYILYVLKDHEEYARSTLKNARIKQIPYTSDEPIKRSLFEQRFWNIEEQIESFDVFHSPFFHSPKFKRAKVVLTVHDLRFCVYPSTYTFKRLVFLKFAVERSVKAADHIISISEFTKNELMKYYNLPQNKITTIHEAINTSDFTEKCIVSYDLDKRIVNYLDNKKFLFSLGHIEPRKNYIQLVKAFKRIRLKHPDVYLVVAGKKAQGYKEFLKAISGEENIIYLDFVSRSTLLWLYKNATAFVFPSIYEGFGFPPLEAAALGTPSAVSISSCIPEICGDGALYFDPGNIDDIEKACERILIDSSVQSAIAIKARENLLRFSWKNNACQTLLVYNTLIH